MPELLRQPERDRLIAFLETGLWRRDSFGGQPLAVPRDAATSTTLCLTDAAARAVELLALPGVRDRWGSFSDQLTDTLLAMGEGPLVRRGVRAPGLILLSSEPQDFRIVAGAYEFTGDLSRGLVRQTLRDGTGPAMVHSGHLLEFRSGGASHCLDVEDNTSHFGIEQQPDGGVQLFHESLFSAPVGLLRKKRFAARLRYTYTIRPDDPRLHLQVMLKTAPNVTLRDIRLTTALDELSSRNFGRIVLGAEGRHTPVNPVIQSGAAEELATLHLGQAEALSLVEEAPFGRALGVHLGLLSGQRLLSVKLISKAPEAGAPPRPHWLLSRYRQEVLAGGQAFTVEEERLLTPGTQAGTEDSYAILLRDPAALRGQDPGTTPDLGVVLNAVAAQLVFAETGAHHLPPARQARLRAWYNRHLTHWFNTLAGDPSRLVPGELAFILLSLDTALRASWPEDGPNHATLLDGGLEMLLSRQGEDGTFTEAGTAPTLAGHLATMLLLARMALRQKEERRVARALRRALAALELHGTTEGHGKRARPMDVPALRGAARVESDSQLISLALRSLGLLTHAINQGALVLEAAERSHLRTLFDASFRLLRTRLQTSAEALEVRSDSDSPHGDAATQAMALLALLAPDETVLAAPPPHRHAA